MDEKALTAAPSISVLDFAAPDHLRGRFASETSTRGTMSRKTIITLALVLVPVALMVLLAWTGWLGDQFPRQMELAVAFAATFGTVPKTILSVC